MTEVKLSAVLFLDLKRKFYPFEMTVDSADVRTHFIYTATASTIPLKTIGQIKFVEES